MDTDQASPAPTPAPAQQKPVAYDDVINSLFEGLKQEATPAAKEFAKKAVSEYLSVLGAKYSLVDRYNILILFDRTTLVQSDADKIYAAVTAFTEKKPILLVLSSNGGSIPYGYLIGKLCREYTTDKFVISVPRRAKSAATLLCCAADEIHMGSLSELGPVDPQIDKMPALGLKSAIDHLADLLKEHPNAAEMFAKYLHLSVQPIHLGYYERVAESAAQYAQKLLSIRANSKGDVKRLASDLVYSYKDHGFVIDKSEAKVLFGDDVIKTNTPEYDFSNEVYLVLDMVNDLSRIFDYNFYFIGSLKTLPTFSKT